MIRCLEHERPSGLQQANDAAVCSTVEQVVTDIEARVEAAVPHYAGKGDGGSLASFRLRQAQREGTPLGRIARPEDVARAMLAACTLLNFTTGTLIPVDGGRPFG